MQRTHLLAFGSLVWASAPAAAVDWENARKAPAEVTVLNCEAVPLVAGDGKGQFLKLPAKLEGGMIFVEASNKKTGNTADFTVVKEGWLFVAAHYGYQGNSSGDWDEKRWTEETFKKNGWDQLSPKQMGGPLVDKGNSEWKVFAKRVRPKDSNRLIVNKYGPPKLFVLAPLKKP